jgi:putative SOS response-associated peptidase YedK
LSLVDHGPILEAVHGYVAAAQGYNVDMCGRYTDKNTRSELESLFGLPVPASHVPRYNISPRQDALILREVEGQRGFSMSNWWFVREGVSDLAKSYKYTTFNARCEEVMTKATFAIAARRGHRCLVPTTGFYEWHVNEDGSKTPYLVTVDGLETYMMAGLWDTWTATGHEPLNSFAVLTTEANPMMAKIHNAKARMPVILDRVDWDVWLNPSTPPTEALALCKPYPEWLMDAHVVSKAVGSVSNDDPGLMDPVRPIE